MVQGRVTGASPRNIICVIMTVIGSGTESGDDHIRLDQREWRI